MKPSMINTTKPGNERRGSKTLRLFGLVTCLLGLALAGQAQTDTVWGVANQGGTYYLGTLFYMGSDGSNLHVVHSFGAVGDGSGLGTSVIEYNGIIYGLTSAGGTNGDGTIFSYNPVTAAYSIVYNFDDTHGRSPNGKLSLNPANGLFYGITDYGGADGSGVIFSFDPATNTYTDLYEMTFNTGGDGYTANPLYFYNGKFYGNNLSGIDYSTTIFSYDPATNTYTDLFDLPDAYAVYADMAIVGYNGVLYTGLYEDNGGDLFSFNLANGTYKKELAFTGANGWALQGIVLSGSTIYGVTYGGNYPDNYGSLFSYSLPASQFSQLYKFSPTTGYQPSGNPTVANGKIIGLTYNGGIHSDGVAYSYDLGAHIYTTLLNFDFVNNGAQPTSSELLFVHPIGVTPQTITFTDLSKTYGDAPFDAGGTASSGLPLSYVCDNPQIAVAVGSQIRIVGAGTANITAIQYGNATYDSTSLTKTITVSTAPLLITAADTVRNQNQPNPIFRAAYSGLVNGDSAGSLTTKPVLSTTADINSLQGTYSITIGGAVDPNYTITYQDGTLTVIGLLQSITFDTASVPYGSPDIAPAAASSGLPVTYSSSNPAIASITPDQKIHIISAGKTIITVTQTGDATYASQSEPFFLQVLPVPLTITADSKTKVYSQPDPPFTATYNGFVNGDDSNALTAKPVFTPTSGPDAAPGVYLIHVDGAADSNYAITYVAGTYLLTPVEGARVNSMDAWFSSYTSLQLDIWTLSSQTALVQVFDMAGHRLINKTLSLLQGNNSLTLPAGSLPSGDYIIRLTGDNLKLTKTIRKIN